MRRRRYSAARFAQAAQAAQAATPPVGGWPTWAPATPARTPSGDYMHAFRTYGDFLAAIQGRGVGGRAAWPWERESIGGLDPATMVPATRTLATLGWPAGMDHVRAITLPAVRTLLAQVVPASGWTLDVTGAAYEMGEYLSGVPECWQAPQVEAVKPVVRIQVDLGLRADIPGRMVTHRGAAVVALTLALQAAGYVVDVAAVCGSGVESDHFWVRVPLSDGQGGPLDLNRLVFGLAHPAMVRILLFGLGAELCGHAGAAATHAGGPNPWAADVALPRMRHDEADWQSLASVTAWVQATYDRVTQAIGGAA